MDLTCGFSNLFITPGMPVRYVSLTQHWNTRENQQTISAFAEWVIRAPALRGIYADYGNLEVDFEKSSAAGVTLEHGFALDTHVVGPGPNQYHDLPMTRDMALAEILRRIDGGLTVDQDRQTPQSQVFLLAVQQHIAIWKLSGSAALNTENIDFRARNAGPWRIVIDMNCSDHSPIRDAWSIIEQLRTYLTEHYGVVITPPSDLNTTPELQVFPKWTQDIERQTQATKSTGSLCYTAPLTSRESPPLAVRALWVREDAWQACLRQHLDLDYKTLNVSFDDVVLCFRQEASTLIRIQQQDRVPGRKWYDIQNARNDRLSDLARILLSDLARILYDRRAFAGELGMVGLTDHVTWAADMFLDGKLSQIEFEQIILDTAEIVWVSLVMIRAKRWICRPSGAAGSGLELRKAAHSLLSAFAQLAYEDVLQAAAEQKVLDMEDVEDA